MKIILNALLILATCGAAYFSYDQSQKFATQQTIRLETKAKEADVSANADATEKDLKDERAALAAAREARDLLLQAITALKSAETSLKRDIAGIDTTLAAQKEEFAAIDKAIAEVGETLKGLGGNITIDNIGDEYAKLEESVKTKKMRMEELNTLIDGAQKKLASGKVESSRLTEKAIESSVRISRNAMEAVITAVNQDWGFLVIGAGSNSGFTPQSSLLVKRDGKLIGRVRPTAIEATQTIADIDLDSLVSGVRIQPGDRVIIATPASN